MTTHTEQVTGNRQATPTAGWPAGGHRDEIISLSLRCNCTLCFVSRFTTPFYLSTYLEEDGQIEWRPDHSARPTMLAGMSSQDATATS